MNAIYPLITTTAGLWLASLVAGLVALRWSLGQTVRRFWAAVGLAGAALLISYAGLTRFYVVYSKSVNERHWSVDSRWFFVVTAVLGGLALALALWRRMKANQAV